ncbi:YraN family protein [Sphingobacterium sp. N143]|uniref:YraN family protein n=1 Tax=Sphingobacterium sp. N143 TaxID=2746727 RepID=UPI002576675C|nr:YraN family protein [Sphingobacterium sp. N143]MDM1293826.1 YraN family protein [Sphingobacterium sp. N143]
MAKHLEIGADGEQMAMEYLIGKGCKIVLRNWRFKNLEVDLIVMDQRTLVFVEVKTRSRTEFGLPQEFVDVQKQRRLIRAAQAYILKTAYIGEVRFDVIAVKKGPEIELTHIKDAFWDS